MKKAIRTVCSALLMTLALTAVAAPPVQYWNSPLDAANHDKQVNRKIRSYQNEGFVVLNVEENPYMYLIAPTGDYTWGTIKVTLRSQSTGMSLETTYVTITCYVDYVSAADGYKSTGFEVFEETVY